MGRTKNKGVVEDINMNIPIWPFAVVTVSLPGVSLALCFITAFLFRFEDVNDTMCDVKNYIPSISAVTGIRPQTYIWRTCIALHSAPRFAVNLIYYNHYINRMHMIPAHQLSTYRLLVRVNYWLNFVESSCLTLVAYISNVENYPVHEKIFIVFMVTSLCYMLLNTILFYWSRHGEFTEMEKTSYWWKKVMFVSIALATIGLIFFFILHRFYCMVGAFSMFSLCEYVIAFTNMGYHFTGYLDFKGKSFVFGTLHMDHSNGSATTAVTNNNTRFKNKFH